MSDRSAKGQRPGAENEFERRVFDDEWRDLGGRHGKVARTDASRWGLALSGGGIRSASFAIGVLQALAGWRPDKPLEWEAGERQTHFGHDESGLLGRFDYLSTVSGGGYAGAFLREGLRGRASTKPGAPTEASDARTDPFSPERIAWLRRHSNFLAPEKRSVDLLALMARVVGPVVVILLQFLALLAGLVALPWVLLSIALGIGVDSALAPGILAIAVALIAIGIASGSSRREASSLPCSGMAALVTLLLLGTLWLAESTAALPTLLALPVALAACAFAFRRFRDQPSFAAVLAPFLPVLAGTLVFLWLAEIRAPDRIPHGARLCNWIFGPAVLAALLYLCAAWYQVMPGARLSNPTRDYWARTFAIVLAITFGWAAFAGFVVLAIPKIRDWAETSFPDAAAILSGLSWIATTLAGAWAAHRARSEQGSGRLVRVLLAVAPAVVLLGLLLMLGLGVHSMAQYYAGGPGDPSELVIKLCWSAGMLLSPWLLWLLLALLTDANAASHSAMYADRLERAFVRGPGAPDESPALKLGSAEFAPIHIVNTAVNLGSGSAQDWQDRRAASFILTPRWCGYLPPAGRAARRPDSGGAPVADPAASGSDLPAGDPMPDDRDASEYPILGDITLAQAVAVSGAAANPNAGAMFGAGARLLLTIFNIRLGWWVWNSRASVRLFRFPFGGGQLLRELSGAFDLRAAQLHLSDGGHFENLGLYELIRRRCRFIVVSDAGCDPARAFEDLGNAIRRCRIDFGAEIHIDVRALVPDERGHAARGCAVGRIFYADRTRGTLLYLKPTLTGNESADVLEYARAHPAFPHQSTADQFFDENQFESYRHLGEQQMKCALAALPRDKVGKPLEEEDWIDELGRVWAPPAPASTQFVDQAEMISSIFRRMAEDVDLHVLIDEFYPEWAQLRDIRESRHPVMAPSPKTFLFCQELIQMMENAYIALDLEKHHAHPDNAGWMNLFHHWSWSPHFRGTWVLTSSIFGARFRDFCRRVFDLDKLASMGLRELHVRGQMIGFQSDQLSRLEDPAFRLTGIEQDTLTQLMADIRTRFPQAEFSVRLFGFVPTESKDFVQVGLALLAREGGPWMLAGLRIRDHLRKLGHARSFQRKLVEAEVGCEAKYLASNYPEGVISDSQRERFAAVYRQWAQLRKPEPT